MLWSSPFGGGFCYASVLGYSHALGRGCADSHRVNCTKVIKYFYVHVAMHIPKIQLISMIVWCINSSHGLCSWTSDVASYRIMIWFVLCLFVCFAPRLVLSQVSVYILEFITNHFSLYVYGFFQDYSATIHET